MNTTIQLAAEKFQEVTAARRSRIHGAALLMAAAMFGAIAPNTMAQGVSSGPCLTGVVCLVGTIATMTNPLTVGTPLVLTTVPAKFKFTAGTVVWVTPMNGGLMKGNLVSLVVLCGPSTKVALPGGASLPGANQVCMPAAGGATLTIPIPAGPEGDELIQKGTPAPSGFWNLFALNPGAMTMTRALMPFEEAPLPGLIRFVPAGTPAGPTAPLPPPAVYSVSPQCVASTPAPPIVTGSAQGSNFRPGARVVVSYIYYTEPNGVFRTDYNGRDSHTGAITSQENCTAQGCSIDFSINIESVHQTAGDPYGLGGNYYVQVENSDGQVSGGPMYFTVKPFQGYGHC